VCVCVRAVLTCMYVRACRSVSACEVMRSACGACACVCVCVCVVVCE